MAKAFNKDHGRLVYGETSNEREALFLLFRSTYQFLRNPPAHRFVKGFTEFEILEMVLLTDLLLKIIEKCKLRE
jgi:hypothetical protein